MSGPVRPAPLALTRAALRVLIGLNQLLGLAILALLVASLVAPGPVMGALGAPPTDANARLVLGMRLIMALGVAGVPFTHVVLTRLRAAVETVRDGDPFVAENAARLRRIAWAVLALEVLRAAVAAVAAGASTGRAPLGAGWSFSPAPWLAVLLLFVLARVFEQGARMREDLAGTV